MTLPSGDGIKGDYFFRNYLSVFFMKIKNRANLKPQTIPDSLGNRNLPLCGYGAVHAYKV